MRTAHTADLDPSTRSAVRHLMDTVFDGFSDDSFENALGGMHALLFEEPASVKPSPTYTAPAWVRPRGVMMVLLGCQLPATATFGAVRLQTNAIGCFSAFEPVPVICGRWRPPQA